MPTQVQKLPDNFRPNRRVLGNFIASHQGRSWVMANGHVGTMRGFPIVGETVAAPPARQAFQILHFGFTLAPIIAGIDKFLHVLVNWDRYLAPWIMNISPIPAHTLMLLVGVVEIIR